MESRPLKNLAQVSQKGERLKGGVYTATFGAEGRSGVGGPLWGLVNLSWAFAGGWLTRNKTVQDTRGSVQVGGGSLSTASPPTGAPHFYPTPSSRQLPPITSPSRESLENGQVTAKPAIAKKRGGGAE